MNSNHAPWQAGTMLHPGAQRSEHRIKNPGIPATPISLGTTVQRQSGRQLGAWSRHHPGASLPLARRHYTTILAKEANNLNPVSDFRGEDQSFFHSLKIDLVHRRRYQTTDEARSDIFSYIEGFYNTCRRHSTIDYCSPNEWERRHAV